MHSCVVGPLQEFNFPIDFRVGFLFLVDSTKRHVPGWMQKFNTGVTTVHRNDFFIIFCWEINSATLTSFRIYRLQYIQCPVRCGEKRRKSLVKAQFSNLTLPPNREDNGPAPVTHGCVRHGRDFNNGKGKGKRINPFIITSMPPGHSECVIQISASSSEPTNANAFPA